MAAKHLLMIPRLLFVAALSFVFSLPTAVAQEGMVSDTRIDQKSSARSTGIHSFTPQRAASYGRYGFQAVVELRVAPGVNKRLNVRQYFPSLEAAQLGFAAVRSALPAHSHLISLVWFFPTDSQDEIGQ